MPAAVLTPQHKRAIQVAVGIDKIGDDISALLTGEDTAGTSTLVGVRVDERGSTVHQTTFNFNNYSVTMTDDEIDNCVGTVHLYTFPAGSINIMGVVSDVVVTKSGDGIDADFDGDFSVGTVAAAADADLTSTEADLLPKTATAQASSGVTRAKGKNTSIINSGAPFDGTETAVEAHLNFLIDYSDQSGGGALLLTGPLTITWISYGDHA